VARLLQLGDELLEPRHLAAVTTHQERPVGAVLTVGLHARHQVVAEHRDGPARGSVAKDAHRHFARRLQP
jgi:hypothetical protein